jgi:hypothetical protein
MKFLNLFYPRSPDQKGNLRVMVTGKPKTGSTAVYHSIRKALPSKSTCLFEPENRALQLPEVISAPVLVKSFIPASQAYDYFDKKILIIRDPRD